LPHFIEVFSPCCTRISGPLGRAFPISTPTAYRSFLGFIQFFINAIFIKGFKVDFTGMNNAVYGSFPGDVLNLSA
jgi:hypothetical protein